MHITKILSFIVTMTFLLFSCIKDDESETINYINVNSQIPTFAVEDTAGNTFSSKQFIGKQSLLVFFGTYCPDCKQVLPVIEEVWKELKDDPRFLLVTISRKETAEKYPFYSNYPVFSILDPTVTYTLPPYQVACGIADTFVHVMEQYMTTPWTDGQKELSIL